VSTGTRLLGVEHEFEVHAGTDKVDFRLLLPTLTLDGRRLDPGDPNAVRCRWGGVITADGKEAEIAIPPVEAGPGSTQEVLDLLAAGRSALEAALSAHDPALRLTGYSTHLSVEVPDRQVKRLARRYARAYAVDTILLVDRADSPGLLVRPRPNRLELGGEFVDGDDLRSALVFCSTAVLALDSTPRRDRPSPVRASLERAVERYGWFVARSAFGEHALESRDAPVVCGRRVTTVGDHLVDSWERIRVLATTIWSPAELAAVDDRVGGRTDLPFERSTSGAPAA
jgi:hypothetical protein